MSSVHSIVEHQAQIPYSGYRREMGLNHTYNTWLVKKDDMLPDPPNNNILLMNPFNYSLNTFIIQMEQKYSLWGSLLNPTHPPDSSLKRCVIVNIKVCH